MKAFVASLFLISSSVFAAGTDDLVIDLPAAGEMHVVIHETGPGKIAAIMKEVDPSTDVIVAAMEGGGVSFSLVRRPSADGDVSKDGYEADLEFSNSAEVLISGNEMSGNWGMENPAETRCIDAAFEAADGSTFTWIESDSWMNFHAVKQAP